MAIVLDSLGTTITRTVFTKYPDQVATWTPFPRAIVNHSLSAGVISAKPTNDQSELNIGLVFDPKFVYRMVDIACSLSQDVANDWRSIAYMELTNAIRNLPPATTTRWPFVVNDGFRIPAGGTGGGEMWMISVRDATDKPRFLIQARPGTQVAPTVTFKATNQTAAAGLAGTVDFWASFLEYEIEQAERFPLHYPASVYQR